MKQLDIIPIYREGKLDRKYWYTSHAKQYLRAKGSDVVSRVDLIFTEYRFTVVK